MERILILERKIFMKKPIIHRQITQLYWGKYPYKVGTICPSLKFNYSPKHGGELNFKECNKIYYQVIDAFRKSCLKYVPNDRTIWKMTESAIAFNFYFVHQEDMMRFVAGNLVKVRKIYEPASALEVQTFIDNKDCVIRKKFFFFNSYRYKITFRRMSSEVICELDTWVKDFFGEDEKRIGYSPCGQRFLYLNVENDILLVRLAFSQYVRRVEKVILKDEINAHDACKKIN